MRISAAEPAKTREDEAGAGVDESAAWHGMVGGAWSALAESSMSCIEHAAMEGKAESVSGSSDEN
jgi:hypothetical protein